MIGWIDSSTEWLDTLPVIQFLGQRPTLTAVCTVITLFPVIIGAYKRGWRVLSVGLDHGARGYKSFQTSLRVQALRDARMIYRLTADQKLLSITLARYQQMSMMALLIAITSLAMIVVAIDIKEPLNAASLQKASIGLLGGIGIALSLAVIQMNISYTRALFRSARIRARRQKLTI